MASLVADMVQDDPSRRPTIHEVVNRFDRIQRSISWWTLQSRLVYNKEDGAYSLRTYYSTHFLDGPIHPPAPSCYSITRPFDVIWMRLNFTRMYSMHNVMIAERPAHIDVQVHISNGPMNNRVKLMRPGLARITITRNLNGRLKPESGDTRQAAPQERLRRSPMDSPTAF